MEADYLGNLPLHWLSTRVTADEDVVSMVAKAAPKACKVMNKQKRLAADAYVEFEGSNPRITSLLSRGT